MGRQGPARPRVCDAQQRPETPVRQVAIRSPIAWETNQVTDLYRLYIFEHATKNRGVDSSILSWATTFIRILATSSEEVAPPTAQPRPARCTKCA